MDSKELKKDNKDNFPRYRVRGNLHNKSNRTAEVLPTDKKEHNKSHQRGKEKYKTTKQSENIHISDDEEKLKQRAKRFNNHDKSQNPMKIQYGYVSRGEDSRLQRSHKERQKYFKHIVSSFIHYVNENSTSSLSKDFDRLISKCNIPLTSQDPDVTEPSSIDSTLNSLRKLREALLYEKANEFTKKVYLFSIRVSVNIGHYQTYIPSITHLLHPNNILLLTDVERQEIATFLVLHVAHFNGENAKALQLYFKYINKKEIKTLLILRSWISHDYYNWIQFYNSETDNGKALIMKFGLNRMVSHMVNAITKAYFSYNLKDFENNYLPNGHSYEQLKDEYNTSWVLDNNTIVVRERSSK